MLEEKLIQILSFLARNEKYNFEFQKKNSQEWFCHCKSDSEKAYALLHEIYHTQSQPKLDRAVDFFKSIHSRPESMTSFKNFCEHLNSYSSETPYKGLFEGLRSQDGWGKKTSALFVKRIHQFHHHPELKEEFKFWKDTPDFNKENDTLYLPVDAVIKHIFRHISKTEKGNDFDGINKLLQGNPKWKNLVIWDDLWFWGFITQNSSSQNGSSRRALVEFNEGKYWAFLHTSKKAETIMEIKDRSKEFFNIIK